MDKRENSKPKKKTIKRKQTTYKHNITTKKIEKILLTTSAFMIIFISLDGFRSSSVGRAGGC